MPARIAVIGSINTDMVVRGPRSHSPGETVTGGTFLQAQGGKGANQAIAAVRGGAEVTFVARVGDDELGASAVSGLREEGIDVSHVSRDPEHATGIALITTVSVAVIAFDRHLVWIVPREEVPGEQLAFRATAFRDAGGDPFARIDVDSEFVSGRFKVLRASYTGGVFGDDFSISIEAKELK